MKVANLLDLPALAAAPATPAAGRVEVYIKTADKRMYYKDDSGTEVGPLAASATGGGVLVTSVTGAASITGAGVWLANGTFALALPTTPTSGMQITVKNTGAGVITINRGGTATIDGQTTITLDVQYASVTLIADGTNWWII